MAVTRGSGVIYFAAANDAVTDTVKIQAIVLDHTAACNAILTNTADKPLAVIRTGTGLYTEIFFPVPIETVGIKVPTLSAGKLYVHLA